MAIAVGSGMPVSAGVVTGIVGGIVVGGISGSPLQVSGPAAGLIVLVASTLLHYQSPVIRDQLGLPESVSAGSMLAVVLALAGLMQLILGWLRLASWFRAVSPAVIQGMLAGIGVLILLGQVHVMMDLKPRSSGLANLALIPVSLANLSYGAYGASWQAALLGCLTLAILVAWPRVGGSLKVVPAPLIAVVAASLLAALAGWQVRFVEVPASIGDELTLPNWDAFAYCLRASTAGHLWGSALAVATLASAESLLCAAAVDKLQPGPRTQYDRELLAQGLGNVLCALVGGLPMTGVIDRSSANIQAGARSRASAILHGVWLLALVCLCPAVLRLVPMASLAGLLVYIGFKLINRGALHTLWGGNRSEATICAVTFVMIVAVDLLFGVLAGVLLSAICSWAGRSNTRHMGEGSSWTGPCSTRAPVWEPERERY
jgi:MFS superfamily sulfate permease-like transporter